MGEHSGVAGGDIDAVALRAVQLGDGFGDAHADADALIVGKRDEARDAPVMVAAD